jgi:transglutaminase-like putative cysteine protease
VRHDVRYRISHDTAYTYTGDVVHSHQLLHLVPRPAPYQECVEHAIEFSPALFRRIDGVDAFGNPMTRVEFEHPHRRLTVTSIMLIDVHARPVVRASDTVPWERARAELSYRGGRWPARDTLEAGRFRHESPYVRVKRAFTDYGEECFAGERPILACAEALMAKLHSELRYTPGATTVATPLSEVLANRRGVCQDFAHLMIACLRSRGLAARYVSGYVRSAPPRAAGRRSGRTAPVGGGASHAWVGVFCAPFGWIELDPTNNTRVGTDHVAIAWGRDFGDVSPLRGIILGGGTHQLAVNVSVEPITPS